jgi:D-glycero-D-manno-heptose 1,7-bisphosphate phosphatase
MPSSLRDTIRYVFLDRDGVINQKMPEGLFVTAPRELVLYSGVGAAIALLNQAGIKVMVVTNQRGVALGLYSKSDLAAIHNHLQDLLAHEGARIDRIYSCPHERDSCNCRKPRPGMILQAFRDFPGSNASNSIMIGDSLVDMQTGNAVGMATVFIEGDAETQQAGADAARELANYISPSLAEFVHAHFG